MSVRARRPLTAAIQQMDRVLRWHAGIYEYTDSPRCILRVSRVNSDEDLVLSDGTQIHRGDPIGEIHLWNERVPKIPASGPNLGWARELFYGVMRSLEELAHHVPNSDKLRPIRALRADTRAASGHHQDAWTQIMVRLGFDTVDTRPIRWRNPVHQLWVYFHSWALLWAFNPVALRGKGWKRQPVRSWMSRQALMDRYARPGNHPKHECPGPPATAISDRFPSSEPSGR